MRAINFLFIFAFCLALALFSLENTESVLIHVVGGVEVQAPLSIELILTLGLGAVLAWMFGVWNRLLRQLEYRQQLRQMRNKDERIDELEKDLDKYKAITGGQSVASETMKPEESAVS
ncbi:MAG: LapA family protein [Coleofasciculaceae cyanobacterium SM2_1_6]|nr:LapA family protein [Coleofasciculaceae cyanobacterium SM2_1_6]